VGLAEAGVGFWARSCLSTSRLSSVSSVLGLACPALKTLMISMAGVVVTSSKCVLVPSPSMGSARTSNGVS
jgi:hypothetical protein